MEIDKLIFDKEKYGRELLIDCSIFSGQRFSLHSKPYTLDFFGIYFITKGKGRILWENKYIDFQKGFLLFFQPGQIRKWENVTNDFDGYFLVFEKEFIETFFQDLFFIHRFQFFNPNQAGYINVNADYFNQLLELCKKINRELLVLKEDSHHLLRSILYQMLIEVNREYCSINNLPLELFKNNLTLQFLQLINKHIRKYHRVDDYCRLLNVSRSHLNAIVKKHTGQSVSEFIKERILAEIKQELLYSTKSIKEICFDMNFQDIPNFNRFFKTYSGMNPGTYRLQSSK